MNTQTRPGRPIGSKKPRSKVSRTYRLSVEMIDQLDELSTLLDMPVTTLIERAVEHTYGPPQ